jgi:peptidoglycan/LPS O-acetylase OafA/YrhL
MIELGAVLFLIAWSYQWVQMAPKPGESSDVVWSGAYWPPFLLCIWVFANGWGFLSRVLSTKPLVYLGEISFGIYMIHWPVMLSIQSMPVVREIFSWSWKIGGWAGGALTITGTTIFLSAACYHLYEIPLRDLIRRKLSFRKAVEPVVESVVPLVESMSPESVRRRAA